MGKNIDSGILATGKKMVAKENEIIFAQNDVGEDMFLLLKDKVGVYINTFDEFPLRVAEIVSGSVFGEMSVLDGSRRSATIIAEEDTILLSIKKEDLPQLLVERPDLTLNLLRVLSERIRNLNEKVRNFEDRRFYESKKESSSSRTETKPADQTDYGLTEPPEYKKYVRKKFTSCPVCESEFLCETPHFPLIRAHTITKEFRKLCNGFEPIWYDIIVCPHCYYANFYTAFGSIRKNDIELLENSGYRKKVSPFKGYSEARTINEVLDALYLAVYCHKVTGNALTQGKVWLRLYWLYTDLNETELIRASAEKAIAAFSLICNENNYNLDISNAQQVMAIMASLHQALGNKERAISYYKNVIQMCDNKNSSVYINAEHSLTDLGVTAEDIKKLQHNLKKWKKGVYI